MQQQHIMYQHSHYATAAYPAAALSAKHVTAAYHAAQHSQSCQGSISYSSLLSMIALSHYEFLILLLPAVYAPDNTCPSVTLRRHLASACMY